MLFPKSSAGQLQTKVDNTTPSEEREIPEGALKYTCRRYNLGIDTGEGEEILDPEIKYLRNLIFMNQNH